MTTIIGLQGDNYALLATDSRISTFDGGFARQVSTLGAGSQKIVSNGKYLLGAAGDVRAINILHHVFTPPPAPASAKGKRLDAFMTKTFIPALRHCFEDQGYAAPERDSSDHMAEHGSTVIVVVHATIYVIEGDYSWTSDTNGIYAIGSGSAYALGALQALAAGKKLTPQQAKTVSQKALSITSRFDPYTGSPFYSMTQEHPSRKKQ
jgi:ATP-dependent protease HslVU (ClpYQ) peptidase subunit